jgi:Zn-dependent metalloprotease
MVYGDGDGKMFLDLSLALDVTAHELTHAVTSKTSALVYKDESGALNEAMSDIFGATTSAWVESGGSAAGSPATVTPTAETWKIGAKAAGPTLMGGALRFMNNPTADKQSKDNYAERFLPGSSDNGGVHSNSGIANLTYYLLSEGGRHPRNKTATVVPGIGLDKAQRIFYQTNTKLLVSSATFQVARFSSAQAATNLYGRCSREWQSVHMAWDAVGVPGKWSLCVEPPSSF